MLKIREDVNLEKLEKFGFKYIEDLLTKKTILF